MADNWINMFNRKYRLRTLMLTLSVGGILLTSLLLLGSLTLFQKGNIEVSLLEGNIAYARKLADTTDRYLATAQRELAYSASLITQLNDKPRLVQETERLRLQSGFFNSVVIVNADAVIAATSPESLDLIGVRLSSAASKRAIKEKNAFISEPFVSAAGNYVVFLSRPLFSTDGEYLGYIGGTIYLKKQSMLSEILSQHFYGKQTEVSVVTKDGRIIFSQKQALVGTHIQSDPALLERLATARSGHFVDTSSRAGLIGFASLNQADWRVLISGTSDSVSHILYRSALNAGWFTLAIIALTVAIVTYFSARLSAPLEKLAEFTRTSDSEGTLRQLAMLNPGYQEAERLRESVSHHLKLITRRVSVLSEEAMKDPLTGLYNRKGFSSQVNGFLLSGNHSIVAIDIDYFKRVNDHHGHTGGDAVLVALSNKLLNLCRSCDIVSRSGGEEFIIFLPHTGREAAAAMAERIRASVFNEIFPFTGHLTLSAGVAALDDCGDNLSLALHQADLALYEAKGAGRNGVVVSAPDGMSRYPE